jgi:hypothetical protein
VIEGLYLRLAGGGSNGRLALFRDAIAAACASSIRAVSKKLLTLVQLNFLVGPKHFAAHAVRNIDGEIVVESDDAGLLHAEAGIVRGHDRVILGSSGQFLGAFDASRNYGVCVEAARLRESVIYRDSNTATVRR